MVRMSKMALWCVLELESRAHGMVCQFGCSRKVRLLSERALAICGALVPHSLNYASERAFCLGQ